MNNTSGRLEIASREDKVKGTHLRWFHHIQKRRIYATIRKVYCLEVVGTLRGERKI